jgi:hypothetical protein
MIVREYLIKYGRHADFRIWRELGNRDSSDEEWEEEFWRPSERRVPGLDAQVDTLAMIDNAFEQEDDATVIEERVREAVVEAFIVVDAVHADCSQSGHVERKGDVGVGEEEAFGNTIGLESEDPSFDLDALEEAMKGLYKGAKCTKLAATILLMNLCTVH